MPEPADPQANEPVRLRIKREAGGLFASIRAWLSGLGSGVAATPLGHRVRDEWHSDRKARIAVYLLGGFVALYLLFWGTVSRTLPSASSLLTYEPPLPTMVRGVDGEIVYSYARERRVQLRFSDFPRPLINAYLSAEDKTFWTHAGLDYPGLVRAAFEGVTTGSTPRGTSTITQQVAKNLLLTNEVTYTRKLKEAVLARRMEEVLTKQQILELYLNQIPLGRQAFGVQAAAQAYFGKDVGQLQLHEAAFLAILPKAPEKYGRAQNAQQAIERRNWVLGQMGNNGFASPTEVAAAQAQPLGIIPRRAESYDPSVGYYIEEVRRRLIDRYGETADDGPNSVYAGGLWVRTSVDPQLQKAAQDALRAGLMRYGGGRGWYGPVAHVELSGNKWQGQLALANKSINYNDWRIGLVLDRKSGQGRIGFVDGTSGPLIGMPDGLRRGDVIAVAPSGNAWAVRIIPQVSGGMAVQDPHSGRVLALQGGFDAGLGSFNRATQAKRQPGSTIKPFVYGTALDNGMTPASEVLDGTFCVYQGARLGQKCFRNFDSRGMGGNHTMRWGLEQSRNLMTVRIANDAGMDRVVRAIDRVGIGKYQPYLSYALGAGETTVLQMTNAYAALANNGIQYEPSTIDYVQDRRGKVIWRADQRACTGCNMAEWDGKPMPRLAPRGKQVMDPRTAYQVVHMLEGVVTRGTGMVLSDLNLPLFGKTGTTTGPTNVWFAGGSQNIVGAVYIGYDQPRSLGGWVQGGTFAAPIFKQFIQATRDRWDSVPFVAPAGIHMIKIDRVSGRQVFAGDPGNERKSSVIWEAFKAETEAPRTTARDRIADQRDALLAALRRKNAPRAAPQSAPDEGGPVEPVAAAIPTPPPPSPAPSAEP